LLHRLRQGDLDLLIGALRYPAPADDITQERLFDDPLSLVVGAGHPLLDDTLSYPWVAPPKTTPAGSYLFDTLRIGERENTPVRVVSSSMVLLRGIMAAGPFITIISPHQASDEIARGHFVPLPVPLENSRRAIGLTFRKDWHPTPTQRAFVEFVRQAAQTTHEIEADHYSNFE
jgi:LysR family transcriptional regulator of gallate degradation